MSDIDTVRLKVSDRAKLHRDLWSADGDTSDIQLEFSPLLALPKVWKNNTLLTVIIDYTVDLDNGIVALLVLPTLNDTLVVEYTSVIYTDAEIQSFLDQASGNVTLASAYLLYAWSVDASKTAQRRSESGGNGLGSISLTTDLAAQQLRASAKAYLDMYNAYGGTGVPAESITEVAWTEFGEQNMLYNWLTDQLN